MAIPPEEMWVIAISGALTGFLHSLCSKEFMQKHRSWAALVMGPSRQLDRLGDWMYEHMPWLPVWPRRR